MLNEKDIKRFDNSDMFEVLANFHIQISEAVSIGESVNLTENYSDIDNIIICGMGGSAIGGDLLRSVLQYEIKIPAFVNRNYLLPAFAGKNTLVIASSYSGNTEETLSAYEEAKNRGCKIICISSGGNLSLLASNERQLLINIPRGYQPRCAIAYSFFPLLILMNKLGFVTDKTAEIKKIISRMKMRSAEYSILNDNNSALKIAQYILGNYPVIFSSADLLDIVNLRWRGQINENAKSMAFGSLLPEMNHNEILGWQENPELLKKLVIISLEDKDDHPQIKKRLKIMFSLISPMANKLIEIEGGGDSRLERIFDLIHLGDWVSFYLAILYKVDPTPVEKINYLKSKLAEN
jgi:glucose/mannose-6-phosphate isomerase